MEKTIKFLNGSDWKFKPQLDGIFGESQVEKSSLKQKKVLVSINDKEKKGLKKCLKSYSSRRNPRIICNH